MVGCSLTCLLPIMCQAIRKAPQHSAIGFKQTAQKFVIVVQLLLGEIPDRATFREQIFRRPLVPYFQLTQGEIEISFRFVVLHIDSLCVCSGSEWRSGSLWRDLG